MLPPILAAEFQHNAIVTLPMSWFARWFGTSAAKQRADEPLRERVERRRRQAGLEDLATNPVRRKSDRALRRELLYMLVREPLIGEGILSAQFKFKVLSVDQEGTQFLVMVDLAETLTPDVDRMRSLETAVVQRAMAQRGFLVKAVYWRLSDAAGLNRGAKSHAAMFGASVGSRGAAGEATQPGESSFPITERPDPDYPAKSLGHTQFGDAP